MTMKVYEIVFSPTGGTKKCADALGSDLGYVEYIDLCDTKCDFAACTPGAGDIAVIAAPSYGGRAPALAVERLGKVRGGGAKCVVMAVYGNRAYEDTLTELRDTAAKAGFRVIAGVTAVAEHSIVHEFAAGRPDAKDTAALEGFAAKIKEKFASGDVSTPGIPGSVPYRKAASTPLVPKASGKCVSCGKCAAACPAGAIDPHDPRKTDKRRCISCMRCVEICPQGARRVSGAMVKLAALAIRKPCSIRKECELYI